MFKNILSILTLVGLFVLTYIDLTNIEADIPTFVYGGMFGIILQANANQILDVINNRIDGKND